ncbi:MULTISPECIES: hypothetical protein [unclassified Crossiella]|uniref:hypothetical protein n=1 Tax=unclassified Crossiella TaxID=2620835 RepID=UPI0020003C93|nr:MULTISPECIES: hypothetical protein [unclassified Crossiella]MCK2237164.1 hypothetical protein [Crossiella sp. S99.2]MCK2252525.1 hypothetical protein [Crossiella sp. S99.1]
MTTQGEYHAECGGVPFLSVPAGGAAELVGTWEEAAQWAEWLRKLLAHNGLSEDVLYLVPGVSAAGLAQVTVVMTPAGAVAWDRLIREVAALSTQDDAAA